MSRCERASIDSRNKIASSRSLALAAARKRGGEPLRHYIRAGVKRYLA